ncbi:MAG: beta strand repeat-containing protein [Calditrichia bacterium]
MLRKLHALVLYSIFMLLIGSFSLAAQTNYSWTNGGGDNDWANNENWSPSGVPASNDTVTISAGDSIVVNSDVTIDSLSVQSGILNCLAQVTVNSGMVFRGGDLRGDDTLLITSGATLDFISSSFKDLWGLTLRNEGTATWSGSGRISLRDKSTITNASGALFDVQGNFFMDYVQLDTGGNFENFGTLRKSSGTGTATIDPTFYNTGTVDVEDGTLRFERGDSTESSTGVFNADSGTTIEMDERIFSFDGASFTGSGTTEFQDAVLTLNGSGMTIASGATVTADDQDCEIDGSGPITVSGTFDLLECTISGSGAWTNNGTVQFTTSSAKVIETRTLTNNATVLWSGSGVINLNSGASINNTGTGNFNIQVNSRIDEDVELTAGFTNSGTITKTVATSTTNFEVAVTNTGTINTNTGRISFEDGSSNIGATFNTASGATFDFNGGTQVVDGITVAGAGSFEVSGTVLTLTGNIGVSAGGVLDLVNNDVNGSGTITNNGTINWFGDDLRGGGEIINNNVMTVDGSGVKLQTNFDITNNGTITWTGSGEWRITNTSSITIGSEGTLDIQNDENLSDLGTGTNSIINNGTITKTAGAASSTLGVDVTNNGTISCTAANLAFQEDFVNASTGILSGLNSLSFSGTNSFTNNGTTSPGTNSVGDLSFIGTFEQSSSANLEITLGGMVPASNQDQLSVNGDIDLDGELEITIPDGYYPAVADSFIVLTFNGSRTGTFSTFTAPSVGGSPQFEVLYRSTYVVVRTLIQNGTTVNLTAFLEGAYRSGSMTTQLRDDGLIPTSQPYSGSPWNYSGSESVSSIPADVVDWVLLELRTGTGSGTLAGRRAAFILSNGSIVDTSGSGTVSFDDVGTGSYYVIIYHRNHLSVMSASTVTLTTSSSNYNFSTAQSQAYSNTGDGMVDITGGVFGLFAGETNDSGIITNADKSAVISNLNTTGYKVSDTNFSGIVTNADKTPMNSNLNAATQVP